jgi:hypothetical protein
VVPNEPVIGSKNGRCSRGVTSKLWLLSCVHAPASKTDLTCGTHSGASWYSSAEAPLPVAWIAKVQQCGENDNMQSSRWHVVHTHARLHIQEPCPLLESTINRQQSQRTSCKRRSKPRRTGKGRPTPPLQYNTTATDPCSNSRILPIRQRRAGALLRQKHVKQHLHRGQASAG